MTHKRMYVCMSYACKTYFALSQLFFAGQIYGLQYFFFSVVQLKTLIFKTQIYCFTRTKFQPNIMTIQCSGKKGQILSSKHILSPNNPPLFFFDIREAALRALTQREVLWNTFEARPTTEKQSIFLRTKNCIISHLQMMIGRFVH